MRSQSVPSPFFPAQRGISYHLPRPHSILVRGTPRFWSRASFRLRPRVAHIPHQEICPGFALKRSCCLLLKHLSTRDRGLHALADQAPDPLVLFGRKTAVRGPSFRARTAVPLLVATRIRI